MHPEILLDIAKLIKKYPPEVWEEVLHQLRAPKFMDEVLYAVSELGRLSNESRVNSRRNDPHGNDLDQVRADLTKRRISEVREYADSLSISFTGKTSKEVLVQRILDTLAKKNVKGIERSRKAPILERPVTEDYQRWGELIMGRKTKP